MNTQVKKILTAFSIRAITTLIIWMVAYHGFIKPDRRADEWLTNKVVEGTRVGLSFLGYDTTHGWKDKDSGESARYIYIDGQPVVLVADPCNGLELIALFIGFLLCFPGPWKYKAIIIPIGTIIVYLINVVREMILALNYKYFQETFDFNHKYTYVFIVYLIIFLMWRFWLNRYSSIGKKVNHA